MLAVNKYTKDYIDECRAKIDRQLAAYQDLAGKVEAGASGAVAALESFEPIFFNNLVLVLDNFFSNRTRALEGKDGNPLNEVRVLCSSIMLNDNTFCVDSPIKMNPAKSVLGHKVGDPVRLTEADFTRLSAAYFAEMEKRFMETAA